MRQVYARLLSVSLALLALAVSACGGGENGNEQPVQRKSSGGFTTYEVPAAGISIAVPDSWETAMADEVIDEDSLDELNEENPELASVLRTVGQADSPMKFFAYNASTVEDFATNVNIVLEQTPAEMTKDEYVAAGLQQLRRIGVEGDIDQDSVELPAGTATRLGFEQNLPGQAASGGAVSTLQYVLLADERAYVITFSTRTLVSEYQDSFERSARSFQLR
jgi:hypothetical protein